MISLFDLNPVARFIECMNDHIEIFLQWRNLMRKLAES